MTEINEHSPPANQEGRRRDALNEDQQPPAAFNEEIEILGEQFQNYLLIAQSLLKTLKRPRDIEICTVLLRKVQTLNKSNRTEVKRNNNYFFRYYLKVLKWTSENQPLEWYKYWYRNQENDDHVIESRVWLEEKKSYMALKLLKDGSIVIYGSLSNDPAGGWQEGGLNILAKRGLCQKKKAIKPEQEHRSSFSIPTEQY